MVDIGNKALIRPNQQGRVRVGEEFWGWFVGGVLLDLE